MNESFSTRSFRCPLLILLAIPLLLVIFEGGYFLWALGGNKDLQKADLIVVFEGGYDRARSAYKLVDQAYAPTLLISPGTERKLAFYEKKYRPSLAYERVMENKSRTTLENAVHTRELIRENDFRSAILVTSWDHMPRSLFLLRALTLGSGIRIQQHPVNIGSLNHANWYRHRLGWMMVYNEIVEFWGSLIELARYATAGELPAEPPGKSPLAERLKQVLLFTIDHNALQG
jgi:uncharacterized SAM-binding protein YcdF (DUF218 family)